MSGAPELDALDLGMAALLILANAFVSLMLGLGLGRRLLVAALRAVVQLALLGMLLDWVFSVEGPLAVIPWMIAMAIVAGWEAVRRSSRRIPGMYGASLTVMLASSMGVTYYSLAVVLGSEPWYDPRFAIPILGMVLGNTLNGISLGLDRVLEGFDLERERIELLLAHGATRREASADIVRRAVRTGMIPILNSMIAVGIISVPGMMTGQILAGADPGSAARYQLFILFAIAGGVALGTMGVVLLMVRLAFDERDRLAVDRIRRLEP